MKEPAQATFSGSTTRLSDGRTFNRYLWDHSSPSQTPFGLQSNGAFLYSVAFHSGNTRTPGISTTITGALNFGVKIDSPACDHVHTHGTSITIRGSVRVTSRSPYTYKWSSDVQGNLGSGSSISLSTLRTGRHIIKLEGRDAFNSLAIANVRIFVRKADGNSCSADDECRSGNCADGVCCNVDSCSGHGRCQSGTGRCLCDAGFGNSKCSGCLTNYYGTSCRYCLASETCSGHGSCVSTTGLCSCSSPWEGGSCSEGPLAVCTGGWTESSDGNSCYLYSGNEEADRKTWTDAQSACRQAGGYLATLDSLAESNEVQDLCDSGTCFFGANDRGAEGTWRWDEDDTVISGSVYSRWASGQPDDSAGLQDCGRFFSSGEWDDSQCTSSLDYVCEKRAECPAGQYRHSDGKCRRCSEGTYNPSAGASGCFACPAGRYGSTTGLTKQDCTAVCPKGHFCVAGSANPTKCPAGTYGATTGLTTSVCSGPVAGGYYSLAGETSATPSARKCAAGRFGAARSTGESGPTSSQCDGPCSAGYYCPAGSTSDEQNECGGNDKYCPGGSGSATSVPSGWRSLGGGTDGDTRTSVAQCSLGTYCVDGVARNCPAGRYAAKQGQSSCDTCSAGYFCPEGSSSATQEPCGGGPRGTSFNPAAEYYCPAGTSSRRQVQSGYYSTDPDVLATRRSGEQQALRGYVVVSGQREAAVSWPFQRDGRDFPCAGQGLPAGAGGTAYGPPASNATRYGRVFVREDAVTGSLVLQLPAVVSSGTAGGETSLSSVTYSILSQSRASSPGYVEGEEAEADQTKLLAQCAKTEEEEDPENWFAAQKVTAAGAPAGTRGDGQLVVGADGPIDRELCALYDVVLQAELTYKPKSDADATTFAARCALRVSLIDVNDPPEIPPGQTRSVLETAISGTNVGEAIEFSDPDDGQQLAFEIIGGNSDGVFRIGRCDGKLTIARSGILDYEAPQGAGRQRVLTIRATDDGTPQLSTVSNVTVNVLDGPEAPVPRNASGKWTFSIAEDAVVDAVVGTVWASDADAGDVLTWSIAREAFAGNPAAGPVFKINGTTGAIYLARARALDHETAAGSEHSLLVRIRDSTPSVFAGRDTNGDGVAESESDLQALESLVEVTIRASNAEEAPMLPPDASQGEESREWPEEQQAVSLFVMENALDGTSAGSVVALDQDIRSRGDSITYTMPNDADGRFEIDSATGVISVASGQGGRAGGRLNAEEAEFYVVGVVATDTTPIAPLVGSQSYRITLRNVNEPPRPSEGVDATIARTVPESTDVTRPNDAGRAVGSPLLESVVDEEGQAMTFRIIAADPAAGLDIFALSQQTNGNESVSSSGQIIIKRALLDAESQSRYTLTVRATDTGRPAAYADLAVAIDVTSLNEPPRRATVSPGYDASIGASVGAQPAGMWVLNLTEGSLAGGVAGADGFETVDAGIVCNDVDVGDVVRYRELLPEEHGPLRAVLGVDASDLLPSNVAAALKAAG